jgi:hypothetical protein
MILQSRRCQEPKNAQACDLIRAGGDTMKSMLFILVAQMHAGSTQTVAADPSLEQCRDALKVAATNLAADYSCLATPVKGTWSPKDSRYLVAQAVKAADQ